MKCSRDADADSSTGGGLVGAFLGFGGTFLGAAAFFTGFGFGAGFLAAAGFGFGAGFLAATTGLAFGAALASTANFIELTTWRSCSSFFASRSSARYVSASSLRCFATALGF